MNITWLSIVSAMLLVEASFGFVRIVSPERLKSDVNYKISTFGLVDYQAGKTIEMKLWNSLDGCDPPTDEILMLGNNIGFLMKKGECSYRRQSVNARRAGAYLVLTYQSTGDDRRLDTPTSDEETRDLELPPVVMISKKNGEDIREALEKGEKVFIFFDWDINIYEPPISVEYLYSVVDYKSVSIYHKLISFQLEAAMNSSNTNTSTSTNLLNLLSVPKFFKRKDFNLTIEDSRKYCVQHSDICVNPHPSVELTQPMDEVIIAGFLFCLQADIERGNKTQNLQFVAKVLGDYAELLRVHQGNNQPINLTQHFEQHLRPADFEQLNQGKKSFISGVVKCLSNNFGDDLNSVKPNNELLQKLAAEGSRKKTKIPALFIGGHLVRGDLTPMTGLSALCDVIPLKVRPTQCTGIETFLSDLSSQLETKESPDGDMSFARRLLYTLLTSCLIFGLTYFIGSCVLQRGLQKDITKDIDESLERYYQIQNTSLEIVSQDSELTAGHA